MVPIPLTAEQRTDPDLRPKRHARSRLIHRAVAGCLILAAVIAAIALAVAGGALSAPGSGDRSQTEVAEGALLAAPHSPPTSSSEPHSGDVDAFIAAWERSLGDDHALIGTVTRLALGDESLYSSAWPEPTTAPGASTVFSFRQAQTDGRRITQIGDVATLTHPALSRRTCLRQTQGFACSTDIEPGHSTTGPSIDAAAVAAVEQTVSGPAATYRVTAVDPASITIEFPQLQPDVDCWEARSLTDGQLHRWGRRAQFCFDDSTGGPVFRRVLSTTRLEILVVDSVSGTVSVGDLDPV